MVEARINNFVVSIQADRDGYRARVLESPAGEGSEIFDPPYPEEEIESLVSTLGSLIRGVRTAGAGELPRQVGTRLFEALFRGKVRHLFDRSLPKGTGAPALQIRLRFDLSDPAVAWLARLPWELMQDPDQPVPLALDPSTPPSRFVEAVKPLTPLTVEPPLRVLAVAANPLENEPLNLQSEMKNLKKIEEEGTLIQVTVLPKGTYDGLREALRERRPHVLHFMGHGVIDPLGQKAALVFETSEGSYETVSGEMLANLLVGQPALRLVVLNACRSGEQPQEGKIFAGVASTLIQMGLPAVVAMRTSVSDAAAISFSRALYSNLALAEPLDVAVTQARKAMGLSAEGNLEWSVPVLFLRAPDGRIFAPVGGESSEVPLETSPSATPNPSVQETNTTTFSGGDFKGGTFHIGGITVGSRRGERD